MTEFLLNVKDFQDQLILTVTYELMDIVVKNMWFPNNYKIDMRLDSLFHYL